MDESNEALCSASGVTGGEFEKPARDWLGLAPSFFAPRTRQLEGEVGDDHGHGADKDRAALSSRL